MASSSNVTFEKYSVIRRQRDETFLFSWRIRVKRGIDFLASSVFILIGLPFIALIAMAIKLTSRGHIFYRQDRVGHHGKIFRIWKFRTMTNDNNTVEHRQYIQYLLKEGSEAEGQIELLSKYMDHVDNRTTSVGRFLRASSLDELPQLINIIKGNMSLVGPRPHPVYEVTEYKEWYKRRLNVKPGLTGWSKLNLRCTPKNYEESILYDLWYLDHWSLTLDIRILMKTIPFVILRKDAR